MFNIPLKQQTTYCDQITRRDALTVGATGLLGGLALPEVLQMQALAGSGRAAKVKSCIFIMLEGGPSHIDMWDLKPDAPTEIRGPFNPISTSVPGIQISEILPQCSKIVDRFSILRSHSHGDNAHQTGRHWVLTGYKPNFPDGQAKGIPFNEHYPSIGSIVSRELGHRGAIPPYIEVPEPLGPGGPGFFGPRYAPFTIETDPVEPTFAVRDLKVTRGIDETRFQRRRDLLQQANELGAGGAGVGKAKTMDTYYEKALAMVTSPAARRGFNIQEEPARVRDRYGMTSIGQCTLLARRLVEAGTRFIGVSHGSWDTHFDNFTSHRKALVPPTDQAFSALIEDLEDRGLLDETLVVMMGEMGRTPRINKDAGRDHWSMCQTVIMAGGGIRKGAVVGASDKTASYPTTTPYGIQDLLFTIFDQMGINPRQVFPDTLGRPVPLVNGGKKIEALLA
ncbi:MAG: DUF1501 domain-containing protein [Planctomycetota bacterium]|nr:DUF1501 domain-containing protein [Planctomycetota bacterium]